jgi:hypothetical protein
MAKRWGHACPVWEDFTALERAEAMKQYKGHPIYGIAIPTPERSWCSRGLIYDQDLTQTIEIKRIESPTDLTFKAKQQAEEHGLKLCRDWIDQQNPAATWRIVVNTTW